MSQTRSVTRSSHGTYGPDVASRIHGTRYDEPTAAGMLACWHRFPTQASVDVRAPESLPGVLASLGIPDAGDEHYCTAATRHRDAATEPAPRRIAGSEVRRAQREALWDELGVGRDTRGGEQTVSHEAAPRTPQRPRNPDPT